MNAQFEYNFQFGNQRFNNIWVLEQVFSTTRIKIMSIYARVRVQVQESTYVIIFIPQ